MYIDILFSDYNMISFNEFVDFDYKINSSSNSELLIGNASATSLNFSIWDSDKRFGTFRFKGSTCFLYEDVERTKKMGVFHVDKITRNKNTLKFECTDNMTKLDEIFKGVQVPFTIYSLIVQICLQLGIQLRNTEEDFAHLTQTYADTNDILGKKCRDVVKWISEVSGNYAIFDEDGKLFFTWYDLSTIKKEIPYKSLKNFQRDEQELNVTGVSILIDKEEEIIGDKTGYDLRLTTDNPLLKTLSVEKRTSILQNIYDKVYGMQYLSCDVDLSIDTNIKIGDTLKVYDEDGLAYKILVTYLNISKLFSMKITSAGENLNRSVDSGSSSGGEATTQEKTYIAKDESWRDNTIRNFHGDTFLNSISIFGVNDKSSALLSFSIGFVSDIVAPIMFKLYTNNILTKQILYNTTVGMNIFTWTETANIKIDEDTNEFKFVLDTSLFEDDFLFTIEKGKSVLNVISTGARAGSAIITALEFKENVQIINLKNKYDDLIISNFNDTLITEVQDYLLDTASDYLGSIAIKTKTPKLSIDAINENVEKYTE